MTKQVYNIVNDEDFIQILKNEDVVYCVSIKSKTIDLAELYNKMKVDINDKYFFAQGLKKVESPENDSERIFNNVYDFISSLLGTLDKKLNELREKQTDDTF